MNDNSASDARRGEAEDPTPALRIVFSSIPRAVLGILILAGVAINFANVLGRHLFATALFWAEEILVFILIWSVFIGIIAVSFNGAHLRMDLLSARFPDSLRKLVNVLVWLIFLGSAVFVVIQSYRVIATLGESGLVSNAAGVPMVVPHTGLLVGFALVILAVAIRVRAYFSDRFE